MTFLISIDRTLLELDPLVFSGEDDGTVLGCSGYQEPAMQPRVDYFPTSVFQDGDDPRGWSWQQSILGWDAFPAVATETLSRAQHAEIVAAITQALKFPVTVTVGDAAPETWTCNPGSVVYATGRTFADLSYHNPVWAISLPCHPVRS